MTEEKAQEWIPFIRKETIEDDSIPYAHTAKPRNRTTIRVWSVNAELWKEHPSTLMMFLKMIGEGRMDR